MCHTYIYSNGPTPKSIEYHLFGLFLELPRQFLLDMSDSEPGHVQDLGFQPI
jgi:hypothetical protein